MSSGGSSGSRARGLAGVRSADPSFVSTHRDFSGASWRLKHAWAKQHFEHLEQHLRVYLSRNPYGVRRRHRGKPNPYAYSFALDVLEQPDDKASLIFGDVVHNLRSALDHLAVALTPCRSNRIAFPIEIANIWETDDSVNFVSNDDEARERYLANVKDMSFEVLALLESLQPYHGRLATPHPGLRPDQEREMHPLRILALLDNADKHRKLVRLQFAMMGVVSLMFVRGQAIGVWPSPHAYDGAEVVYRPFPPKETPPESEVEVRVFGTNIVSVEIGLKDAMIPVLDNLRMVIERIPLDVFDVLEDHVLDE